MRHQDFNIIFQPPKEATSGFKKCRFKSRSYGIIIVCSVNIILSMHVHCCSVQPCLAWLAWREGPGSFEFALACSRLTLSVEFSRFQSVFCSVAVSFFTCLFFPVFKKCSTSSTKLLLSSFIVLKLSFCQLVSLTARSSSHKFNSVATYPDLAFLQPHLAHAQWSPS